MLASATVACIGGGVSDVEACSCVTGGPMPAGLNEKERVEFQREATRKQVSEVLGRSYAIFSGEVITIEGDRAKFKLEELWKGDLPQEFSMASGGYRLPDGSMTITSCDYTFTAGRKYLVFAQASATRNMEAMPCTPTRELTSAADVVAILNELMPNRPKK